jgi:hypothetical protein
MTACKYWDCGWCYAPNYLKTNAINSTCVDPNKCPISPLSEPVQYETPMTEIEELKAQIKVLEKKVALLEEIEKYKNTCLYALIEDWWEDVFTTHSDWDMETSIEDLVDQIQLWLPKEQSAAGSQNAYVESAVEGFNDCLQKIKRKLR